MLNVIFAYVKETPKLFAIGLTLFILCDTIIGLENLESYISLSSDSLIYKMINVGFNLAWVFYLPSQVLIALTINHFTLYKKTQMINNI